MYFGFHFQVDVNLHFVLVLLHNKLVLFVTIHSASRYFILFCFYNKYLQFVLCTKGMYNK